MYAFYRMLAFSLPICFFFSILSFPCSSSRRSLCAVRCAVRRVRCARPDCPPSAARHTARLGSAACAALERSLARRPAGCSHWLVESTRRLLVLSWPVASPFHPLRSNCCLHCSTSDCSPRLDSLVTRTHAQWQLQGRRDSGEAWRPSDSGGATRAAACMDGCSYRWSDAAASMISDRQRAPAIIDAPRREAAAVGCPCAGLSQLMARSMRMECEHSATDRWTHSCCTTTLT